MQIHCMYGQVCRCIHCMCKCAGVLYVWSSVQVHCMYGQVCRSIVCMVKCAYALHVWSSVQVYCMYGQVCRCIVCKYIHVRMYVCAIVRTVKPLLKTTCTGGHLSIVTTIDRRPPVYSDHYRQEATCL